MRQRQQRTNYLRQKQQPGASQLTAPILWWIDNIAPPYVYIRLLTGDVPVVLNGLPAVQNQTKGLSVLSANIQLPSPDPSYNYLVLEMDGVSEPGDVFTLDQPSRAVQTNLGACMAAQITGYPFAGQMSLDFSPSISSWDATHVNLAFSAPFGPLLVSQGAQVINLRSNEQGIVAIPDNLTLSVEFPADFVSSGDQIFIPGGQLQFSGPYGGRISEATLVIP